MTPQPTETLIDATTLLAACGSDPLLLRKMIESFQRRAPDHLAGLRDAARRRDAADVQHAAHKLRGLVSTFSSTTAVRVGALEQLAADGLTDAPLEHYEVLAQLIGGLTQTLSSLSVGDLERLAASNDKIGAP